MFLKWGMKVLNRTSPLTFIAGGVILAFSSPNVRRAVRSVAVKATAGMLSISENLREGLGSIIAEAKTDTSLANADCLEVNNEEVVPDSPGL